MSRTLKCTAQCTVELKIMFAGKPAIQLIDRNVNIQSTPTEWAVKKEGDLTCHARLER